MIVNADDFGLTAGINRAVAELHDAGALTSTTLIASSDAFDHAVQLAQPRPFLAVGCHLTFVDGSPTAAAASIPSLVSADGRFRSSLVRFVCAVFSGCIRESEIEIEATAQVRRLQAAGVTVSHIDTHKHAHLISRIAAPLIRAAVTCGVHAIRNPFEPPWSARISRGRFRRAAEAMVTAAQCRRFHELCDQHAVRTTDGCIGLTSMGALNSESLKAVLYAVPPGTWELVCHPGYNDADLANVRTRLRQSRDVERRALMSQILPTHPGIGLINFHLL